MTLIKIMSSSGQTDCFCYGWGDQQHRCVIAYRKCRGWRWEYQPANWGRRINCRHCVDSATYDIQSTCTSGYLLELASHGSGFNAEVHQAPCRISSYQFEGLLLPANYGLLGNRVTVYGRFGNSGPGAKFVLFGVQIPLLWPPCNGTFPFPWCPCFGSYPKCYGLLPMLKEYSVSL